MRKLRDRRPAESRMMTQAIRAEPRGIGRLLRPVMAPMLRKLVRTLNAELKEHVEQGERGAAPEIVARPDTRSR